MGKASDRIVITGAPPAQSAIRMGMDPRELYRPI